MYPPRVFRKKVNHFGKFFRGNSMYISQKGTTMYILTFYPIFTFGKKHTFFGESATCNIGGNNYKKCFLWKVHLLQSNILLHILMLCSLFFVLFLKGVFFQEGHEEIWTTFSKGLSPFNTNQYVINAVRKVNNH